MEVASKPTVVLFMRNPTRRSLRKNRPIRLKLWRLQQDLTQERAARWIGISESSYALLESGRLRPTPAQLDLLRRRFGNEVESLFDAVRDCVEVIP